MKEVVVVSFLTGRRELAEGMLREVRSLLPDLAHYAVSVEPFEFSGVHVLGPADARAVLRGKKIGLAPLLLGGGPKYRGMRRLAARMAPHKLLAYNQRLERHHLRLSTWIASLLFLRGVPLDRIWLRPRWLFPWRSDRTGYAATFRTLAGRPPSPLRRKAAVLTPYFPFPLSHGGAVRIFHLLREAAAEFDISLFSFGEPAEEDLVPVLELCAGVTLVPNTRYREPRWATLLPPEVHEFTCPLMRRLLAEARCPLLQVEYTQMGLYGGDVLVEHDVTFDLYRQVWLRERNIKSWWDYFRWKRFERRIVSRFPRVVVMSDKDRDLLGASHAVTIPNGVDLERFRPAPERPGRRLLFVGSFRHFPNVDAYRFFRDQVWPRVLERHPGALLTVVAGPDHELHWSTHASGEPGGDSIQLLGFVQDVRPLYEAANLAVVPTRVSAGTNLKVLEALAMERAIVSTSAGCAGLGLEHGRNIWIADAADEFMEAVVMLLTNDRVRTALASAGRQHAMREFDWRSIGNRQRELWRQVLSRRADVRIRAGTPADVPFILEIQSAAGEASQWDAKSYLEFDLLVAESEGMVAGFLVSRQVATGEREILNIAVSPAFRRTGIATKLIRRLGFGTVFLEVRQSNAAARALYRNLGFEDVGCRHQYYENPTENAVVMRLSGQLKGVNV